jgi:acetyl esterase/lipase
VSYVFDPTHNLKMDVFTAGAGPNPAVVAFHGGPPGTGGHRSLDPLALSFTSAGIVFACIDWRTDAFPHALDDGESAVAFLKAHAAQFGVDPARIGSFGVSFGGAPACGLGTIRQAVKFQVAWSGIHDCERFLADPAVGETLKTAIRQYVRPWTAHAASNINHVSATSARTLLVTSANETIPAYEAEGFAQALAAAGAPVKIDVVAGTAHGLHLLPVAIGPTTSFAKETA